MAEPRWVDWSPSFAPWVKGRYTERVYDAVAKMHESQRVEMRCEDCKAFWQTDCASGHVRDHIVTFASVHMHRVSATEPNGRDALAAPTIVRPGSMRVEEIEKRERAKRGG